MKKNNIVFIAVALIVVGLIVFLKFNQSKVSTNQETNKEETQATVTKTAETKGNVLDSIKDAIAKNLSFKCEYNMNNSKTTVYVKGTAMRIEGLTTNGNTGAIIKDNKLWSWDTVKKEGVIMPLDANQNKAFSQEEITNNLEKQKQFCQVTVVAESIFTPPSDIKFQDLSEMFKKLTGMPQQ